MTAEVTDPTRRPRTRPTAARASPVGADRSTPLPQRGLPQWGLGETRSVFRRCAGAPQPAQMTGRWDGTIVGSTTLRMAFWPAAQLSPLRGWCGKVFDGATDVRNLVRRRDGVHESVRGEVMPGQSLLDGRPVLVVDYSATSHPPLAWTRGELRWLTPGREVLGVLLFRLGRRVVGPVPFLLTPSSQPTPDR